MKAIHEFARDQVAAIKRVNAKFQNKDQVEDVKFEEFQNYPERVWVEVDKGIFIFIHKYTDKFYIIECKMKGFLAAHKHSDFSELFVLIEGWMKDNMDETIHLTTQNDNHVYDIGRVHEPIGENRLVIIGKRA